MTAADRSLRTGRGITDHRSGPGAAAAVGDGPRDPAGDQAGRQAGAHANAPADNWADGTTRLTVQPVDRSFSLKTRIYDTLRTSILSMNIASGDSDPRLDERRLAEQLGVSRTPVREALARLEQEGFVRTVPRKGVFVVRKTRHEVIEMITVWAALEGMAARLAAVSASDADIAGLHALSARAGSDQARTTTDALPDAPLAFHRALLRCSHNALLVTLTDRLFLHMRSIPIGVIAEADGTSRAIADHGAIIAALERRDAEGAEWLARTHIQTLATRIAAPAGNRADG